MSLDPSGAVGTGTGGPGGAGGAGAGSNGGNGGNAFGGNSGAGGTGIGGLSGSITVENSATVIAAADGVNALAESATSTIAITNSGTVGGTTHGIQASAPGDIDIVNSGLITSANLFAINTDGASTEILNTGTVRGFVNLTDQDDFIDNQVGGIFEARGTSNFGGNTLGDLFDNSGGTVLSAVDPTINEAVRLDDLEAFRNLDGLITMVDGREGDSLTMSTPLLGGTSYNAVDGRLAVDALLAPPGTGLSDQLIINGFTNGTTLVAVNVVDVQGANLEGIPVVVVNGLGTPTFEEDFDLENGPFNAGFFTWDLRLDGTQHELFTSGIGVGAFEFAAGITGAQDIWHQTTGTLLQRQADLRPLLEGTQVTPVADFAEPVEPTPVAQVTPGFWLRGVGAWLERDAEQNGFSLDRDQKIYGIYGGFDFGTENVGDEGDALMFGVLAGYISSDLEFDETNTEWTYEGPSIGVYATYLDRAFSVDALVKADFLDIEIDPEDLGPAADNADTDAVNIGGRLDAGYKFGHEFFVEPQASLAVVHTEIDDVDIFGGTVEFDDETSVRGRLGLRLGFDNTGADQVVYTGDVTASVWQEFAGDNDATIVDTGFPAFGVSDDPGATYGDVSVGFSVAAPDGWSGFLRGNYQFGDDFEAISGNAGVRYAW